MMESENLWISPECFFATDLDCWQCESERIPQGSQKQSLKQRYLLPAFGNVFGNAKPFASVFMAWQRTGLLWRIEVTCPDAIRVSYPQIQEGDSIELFIDTRDVKSARSTHRFCHHFFFLPESVEGVSCGEITRFRTEDTHRLATQEDLVCKISRTPTGYTADITIARECLTGFDPEECARIGFAYQLNRSDGERMRFGYPSEEVSIARYPYLWSTLNLKYGDK